MDNDTLYKYVVAVVRQAIEEGRQHGWHNVRPWVLRRHTNDEVNDRVVKYFQLIGYDVYVEPHVEDIVFNVTW